MGDTHITGRHIGRGTHITGDMCAGIHISRGYTYQRTRMHQFGRLRRKRDLYQLLSQLSRSNKIPNRTALSQI